MRNLTHKYTGKKFLCSKTAASFYKAKTTCSKKFETSKITLVKLVLFRGTYISPIVKCKMFCFTLLDLLNLPP